MPRPHRQQLFDGLLDFGAFVGTSIADAASSVLGRVRGAGPASDDGADDGDIDDAFEESQDAEVWGCAGVLFRPEDPSSEGSCEAIYVRRGDERVVICTKDRRWQIEIDKGELYLRNTVAETDFTHRASIYIKRNGEVVIDAVKVYVGDASAGHTIAWGDVIKSHLDGIKTFLDLVTTHTHVVSGASAAASVALAGGSPSVPGIESTHVVE